MRRILSWMGIAGIVPIMLLLGGCGWEPLVPNPNPGVIEQPPPPSELKVQISFECTDCVQSEGDVAPLTFKFQAQVTLPDPAHDPVLLYSWNFGDGIMGEGGQVRHTFETPGTYQVRLRVITSSGAEARAMVEVVVEAPTLPQEQVQRNAKEGDLCSFERVLPESFHVGGKFTVQVTIRAKQNVQVVNWEDNVWFPEFRLKHEPSGLWLGMKAGESIVLVYEGELWQTPKVADIWMSGTLSCNPGGSNDSETLTLRSELNIVK